MNNEAMGQMVPFVRNSDYLRKLALKQRGLNKPVRAIELLRLSLEKAPDDVKTKLELAKMYASAHCPALSNRILFTMLDHPMVTADCFYLLAQNFMSMRMDPLACDCLSMYLQKKPYGIHAGEAVELLELMGKETDGIVTMEDRVNARIFRVLSSLDGGKPELAIRQIHRVLALDRRNSGVHALLSFALLGAGDAESALQAARKALRYSSRDLRALCAVAVSLHALGMKAAGKCFLSRALESIEDEEDAQVACQTACEMKEHTFVKQLLKDLEQQAPYAVDLLHPLATASFNSGDLEEARRCWRLILRLNPMDSVARYRLTQANQETLEKEIPYTTQVPLSETLLRLSMFREWMKEGKEQLVKRWTEDSELSYMLRWGLESMEPGIPQAMISILSMLEDEKAKNLLKEILCDAQIGNFIKHTALAALCLMDQKGPFYALISHRLTIVNVAKIEEHDNNARAKSLFESVRKRFSKLSEKDCRQMKELCRIAAQNATPMGEHFRLNGVELAMRRLRGEHDFVRKQTDHRKLNRYAFRIIREYQKNAMFSF